MSAASGCANWESAARTTGHWKPRYYLALALWGMGRTSDAWSLLNALGEQPDYAPFYAARASFPGRAGADARRDLEHAGVLDPGEWRYGKLLAEHLLASGDATAAVGVARRYRARFPASYILGLTMVRALIDAGQYREADAVLSRLNVLPYEGAADGHVLYRQAKLLLAVEAMGARQWKAASGLIAAARQWPERLGAGKPYPADVDERLEDWLMADVLERSGKHTEAAVVWTRLSVNPTASGTASDVLPLWSLERLGKASAAQAQLARWPAARTSAGSDGAVLSAWTARVTTPPRSR